MGYFVWTLDSVITATLLGLVAVGFLLAGFVKVLDVYLRAFRRWSRR